MRSIFPHLFTGAEKKIKKNKTFLASHSKGLRDF
jgi:hypothetical protein